MRIERRDSLRLDAAALPAGFAARLRAGSDADVLNVSPNGVLLESTTRLLPGRRCALRIGLPAHQWAVDGEVVRCALTRVTPAGQALYRAAIRFSSAIGLPSP